jgi:unsaturated rhamnogalacturonyl hydrolase
MRKILIALLLCYSAVGLIGQPVLTDKGIVILVADNILNNTTYNIVDKETGILFKESSNLTPNKEFYIESPYVEWKYWNGVLNIAMIELYRLTGEDKYKQQAIDNYQFIFDNLPFFEGLYKSGIRNTGADQLFKMEMLDDCGAMGAGLIDVYQIDKRKDYHKYIEEVANYMLKKEHRLADGTLARLGPYNKTLWLDDLYMSIPFLARYARLTNDNNVFEFASKQILKFTEYLYDKNTGIYYHCYFDSLKTNGVAHWGRANGWSIMAQSNLLEALPVNFPLRDTLLKIFRQQVNGLARYQSESGLWHQLLDKPDSYLETSCSAMFTYAIAKGVNEGWLDEKNKTIALAGWEGLKTKIQIDGQVKDICVGTWIQNDLVFYYTRPTQLNDIHGLGAVLLAGIEILKMKK